MGVVKDFSRHLLAPVGAPTGAVSTYIEVPFSLGKKRLYPDGLIRVQRGSKVWTALVEVKTGRNELQAEQLEAYLDIAKEQGYDALITISNEIPVARGEHPTRLDKRKLRKVAVHHWSWTYLLASAVVQKEHRGVSDPEQAWILGELIRYLEHPKSGAMELDDMGSGWVPVRQAVHAGTLRPTDECAPEVVSRFDALLRYTSLKLGRQLGTDVTVVRTRKEAGDPTLRAQALLNSLTGKGLLFGAIKIPDTVGPMHISVDLRASRITCYVDIDAPKQGRPTTRVNWLLRQLKNAPPDLRVEASVMNGRGPGAAELLSAIRDEPSLLVTDPKKELKSFRVAFTAPMGAKRGRGKGAFIDSVVDSVDSFYGDVVQHMKTWSASPPRLRATDDEEVADPRPASSTALSSQDGPETA
ncbi:hypothetical protein K0651_03155 [Ornithinimicrobium sp. Arc0846-15]|nr:hypothetical protein [Ornithinimicrobium laminariae]